MGIKQVLQLLLEGTAASSKYPICGRFRRVHNIVAASVTTFQMLCFILEKFILIYIYPFLKHLVSNPQETKDFNFLNI